MSILMSTWMSDKWMLLDGLYTGAAAKTVMLQVCHAYFRGVNKALNNLQFGVLD